jgi:hypothetical protein
VVNVRFLLSWFTWLDMGRFIKIINLIHAGEFFMAQINNNHNLIIFLASSFAFSSMQQD